MPTWTLNNQVNKQVRIRRLTQYLGQKQIRFKANSPGARLLVNQLREFPLGDHDDGPDALEMAIRLAGIVIDQRAEPPEPTYLYLGPKYW
jgi:predicted phage terminase large subunit-like protein